MSSCIERIVQAAFILKLNQKNVCFFLEIQSVGEEHYIDGKFCVTNLKYKM